MGLTGRPFFFETRIGFVVAYSVVDNDDDGGDDGDEDDDDDDADINKWMMVRFHAIDDAGKICNAGCAVRCAALRCIVHAIVRYT